MGKNWTQRKERERESQSLTALLHFLFVCSQFCPVIFRSLFWFCVFCVMSLHLMLALSLCMLCNFVNSACNCWEANERTSELCIKMRVCELQCNILVDVAENRCRCQPMWIYSKEREWETKRSTERNADWNRQRESRERERNAFDHFYLNNDYSVIKIYNFLHVHTYSACQSIVVSLTAFGISGHMCVSGFFPLCQFSFGFSAILLVDSVCSLHRHTAAYYFDRMHTASNGELKHCIILFSYVHFTSAVSRSCINSV